MNRVRITVLLCSWLFAMAAQAAPPFRVPSDDGKSWISPGNLEGKLAVFLFWDTECAPCLRELSDIARLKTSFPGASFVIVSLSPRADARRALAKIRVPDEIQRAQGPANPLGLLRSLGNRDGALPFSAAFRGNGTKAFIR